MSMSIRRYSVVKIRVGGYAARELDRMADSGDDGALVRVWNRGHVEVHDKAHAEVLATEAVQMHNDWDVWHTEPDYRWEISRGFYRLWERLLKVSAEYA